MTDRVSIEDIANEAGVSKATVSQVLRNAGRISAKTRQHVMNTANRMGYVYNRAAANLRSGASTMIGIGVSSLTNPFFAELVGGAAEVLEEAGFFPMIASIEDSLKRQQWFARSLRENASSGAILTMTPGTSEAMLREWQDAVPRCVTVLRPAGGVFDFVGVDNAIGAAQATDHLIAQGHRTIGFLGGLPASASRAQRLKGWCGAMGAKGLDADNTLVEPCGATISEGSAAVKRLLGRRADITAIVCHQDIVAYGATIGLRSMGLEPGREVSVVGFDGISMSEDWDPPLTTVSVTPGELGAEAARLLVRRIREPGAPLQSVYIRPELVVRQSTSAPAAPEPAP